MLDFLWSNIGQLCFKVLIQNKSSMNIQNTTFQKFEIISILVKIPVSSQDLFNSWEGIGF